MAVTPQVRGTFPKFLWRTVKRLEGELGERLRAGFPPALRARIREVPRLSWCGLELFRDTFTAIYELGGAQGARVVWRACLFDCIDLPLIRPLAQGGLALFGRTPAALVQRTPQAWALVTRHCGVMRAAPGLRDDEVTLDARLLPAPLCTPAFVPMFEGGFRAQLDFVGAEGEVRVDAGRLRSEGMLRCRICWDVAQ